MVDIYLAALMLLSHQDINNAKGQFNELISRKAPTNKKLVVKEIKQEELLQ